METKPLFSGRITAAIVGAPVALLAIVGAIKAYEDGIGAIVPGAVVFLVFALLTLLGIAVARRKRYVLLGIVFLAMVALDASVVYVFHLSEQMMVLSMWDTWVIAAVIAAILYWRDRRNGPDAAAS